MCFLKYNMIASSPIPSDDSNSIPSPHFATQSQCEKVNQLDNTKHWNAHEQT